MAKVCVIGSGSFGCALSVVLSDNGHEVTLWSHSKKDCEELKIYHSSSKLPGARLSLNTIHTTDLADAVKDKDLLVIAVPSKALREMAHSLKTLIPNNQKLITVSKGIEEETLFTPSDILKEELPDAKIGILSGPSHAEEVIRRLPTVVVAGAEDEDLAKYIQEIFMNPVFRVYTSKDVIGIELGASLKNVIALAAGVASGMGFGDNTAAALITRGIKEITDLGIAMGAYPETLLGLCGVGDLIVTCQSKHSRNRTAGVLMGEGYSPKEAIAKVNMVVEGFHSAKAAKKLGEKYNIDLPIINEVNEVLFNGLSPKDSVMNLMKRDKKAESDRV